MPTGYTNKIKDGISFETFALQCARAFGACINLRDEAGGILPTIANIQSKNDNYHADALKEANSELLYYNNLTEDEWQKAFEKYILTETEDTTNIITEKKELKQKYVQMLTKVEEWNPPTTEHHEFKKFMKEQISTSVDFDCDLKYNEDQLKTIQDMTVDAYKELIFSRTAWNVKYHTENIIKEEQRNNTRVDWLQQLIDSLK